MNVDLQALAGPRDRLMVDGAVDPVTAEVIRGTMETVCFEMAMYVSRTATTPILNQSNERNATILDGKGRLAALSELTLRYGSADELVVRHTADWVPMEAGDKINFDYGGGGWGDPLERPAGAPRRGGARRRPRRVRERRGCGE